ncbi:winged helix-turn-helix domain-containing protein [Pararhodonellum marinum]|uniref:winged helix-turn-helix domain-containing protein n=1 Tax=Pararhodonellum marinum TaxID=2755358 RepID=UPI0018902F09|nr:winged helix-turn-helix domain-containing protein [Pararhodonellum marinum]
MSQKKLRIRCWIELDDSKFFGPGRAELLELIVVHGSVSKASKAMGMSYKKAWEMVNDLNNRSPEAFVVLQKGGQKGGSAMLTDFGRMFLKKYRELDEKIKSIATEGEHLLDRL